MAWFTRQRIGAVVTGLSFWIKPLLRFVQIPGYIDDGLAWGCIFKKVGSMMTTLDWTLLGVGALSLTYGFFPVRWLPRGLQGTKVSSITKDENEDLWIAVAGVVNCMVSEYETYRLLGSDEQSKLRAFQDLHESMGTGELEVRGSTMMDSKRALQIRPKLCRKLKPIIADSTIGSVYNLKDPTPDPPAIKTKGPLGNGEVRWQGQGIYSDLRVRRRDLYKSWPKIAKQLEQISSSDKKELRAKIETAYQYVSQALDPRILNPEHPGNPHAIKHNAQDATDTLMSQLKAQGIRLPPKLDAKNNESLKTWHDFLRELRINHAAFVKSR